MITETGMVRAEAGLWWRRLAWWERRLACDDGDWPGEGGGWHGIWMTETDMVTAEAGLWFHLFCNIWSKKPQKQIKKMTSRDYNTSGAISQTNMKAFAWNFVCVFYNPCFNTYFRDFWKYWEKKCFSIFFGEKMDFLIFGVFRLQFPSLLDFIRFFKHLPLFHPKWHKMTLLKRHFLPKKSINFVQIFCQDVILMPNKV